MRKLAFLFVYLILAISCQAGIIYVDADANGADDGSSWANAYNFLQDALSDANSDPNVDEIRVAQGTYTPDSNSTDPNGSGDRTATFQLINGVAIYGGFPSGGDPNFNDRDHNLYRTFLSGDLGGNDVDVNDPCDLPNEPARAENSYHVVTGSGTNATAVLDGFTITAGNANGSYPNNMGCGIYNEGSSPTVTNCTFSGNSVSSGSGILINIDSNPRVSNCTFSGNSVEEGSGILTNVGSNPRVSNCTFSGNSAGEGGGMSNTYGSSPTVSNCTFSENSAGQYGGGMFNYYYSSPTVTDCTFSGNSAGQYGGGMFNWDNSNPTLKNCTFSENSAEYGGGMFNYNNCNPTVSNCTFSGNSAEYGGGMGNDYSNPTLTNCTFSANSADEGGGMYNNISNPTVTGCTFSGNSAGSYGGGMYNFGSSPTVTNCILWGDTAASDGNEIALDNSSTIDVNYCDIKGGQTDVNVAGGSTLNWGLGNIEADPCFVKPGYWADANDPNIVVEPNDPNAIWVEGDYHLLPISPCIDAGDPNYVAEPNETDLDGNPRVFGDRIDMGAYETALSDPVELLDILAQDIIDLELRQGIKNSLLVKLDTALQKLEDDNENNDKAAINSLQAFINAVNAQRGKKIPEAEVDALIAAAQEIIDLLSDE